MLRRWISFILVASIAASGGCGTADSSDAGPVTPDAGLDLPARDVLSPDTILPDTVALDAELPSPLKWVNVAAGTFSMGSPTTEPCREQEQEPETQHQVTLTRKFEILSTEVTQAQFSAEMGYNPSGFTGGSLNRPVEKVTWHEAITYCNALSTKKKLTRCYSCSGSGKKATCSAISAYGGSKIYTCPGYRLPTEAEWEYAYRAGTKTAYYNGANDPGGCSSCTKKDALLDKIGWYSCNSFMVTRRVALKQPNAWGLYDMAGNVWEWCHDRAELDLGSKAVTDPSGTSFNTSVMCRGGCWGLHPTYLRAASRNGFFDPTTRAGWIGFRVVRSR
jgi:formylglycine-generating enzyme required for sulfatase activity